MAVPNFFNITLPPDAAEGHYADFANIWHNQETFILDFAAMTEPPVVVTDELGQLKATTNAQVVTRVRVPAAQVWELMKALQAQLGAWEMENPHRKPPQPDM